MSTAAHLFSLRWGLLRMRPSKAGALIGVAQAHLLVVDDVVCRLDVGSLVFVCSLACFDVAAVAADAWYLCSRACTDAGGALLSRSWG